LDPVTAKVDDLDSLGDPFVEFFQGGRHVNVIYLALAVL
jgi:hypothetical protein